MEEGYTYFVSCKYKNKDAHIFLHMSLRVSKYNIRDWYDELVETIVDVTNKGGVDYIMRSDVVIVSFQEIL